MSEMLGNCRNARKGMMSFSKDDVAAYRFVTVSCRHAPPGMMCLSTMRSRLFEKTTCQRTLSMHDGA